MQGLPQLAQNSGRQKSFLPSRLYQFWGSLGPSNSSTPQQSSNGSATANVDTYDIIDRGLVTPEMAQVLLDNFRFEAAQHYPFVIIPPHVTLNSVRCGTPFLFLCIIASMMVKDCSLQRQIGEEIRAQVHQRILFGYEKSLEILHGLLVHLAWYHYQILPQKQQILLFTQLCITRVQELRLDIKPKNGKSQLGHVAEFSECNTANSRSNAELRALLGTYFMASS
jgi:hypothetical protein